ncbi:hypothetical protein SUGI_0390710 [Cryptomeria japonica]|nr:hypothetical protein SUGI_0390710 [Cryptomeria japonica]
MVVLGKFKDFIVRGNQNLSDVVKGKRYLRKCVGGDRYWSNQIPQHCLIKTWLDWSPIMCKMSQLFPKPDRYIVSWYTQIRHLKNVPVEDDLKDFIFGILKKACYTEFKNEECRWNVYNFEKDLFQRETEIRELLKSHVNLEEVILIWHIATTLCDKQTERAQQNEIEKELP